MEKRCYGCMQIKTQSPICEHCGFNENVENLSHQLPMGTVLRDQYLVGKVLGQGGFGITYLGWDLNLDIPIAIKEYYPNGFVNRECTQSLAVTSSGSDAGSLFQHNRERFLREARSLARLREIPEIVRVHNFFKENNTAYIIMEYIKGIDLRCYVNMKGGKMTVEETFTILRPVMEALSKVHEEGLVHRDISPDNIMMLPKGGAKLLDFGAVREVADADADKNLSQSTEAILKHGFAPMEQYQKRGSLGPWTDVYALCATIYYCLTGRVPPDAPARLLEDAQLDWRSIHGLTEQQIVALEKGMELLPKNRTGSVAELYSELFAQPAKLTEPTSPVIVPEEKAIPVKPQEPEEKPYPSQTLPLEKDAVTDYMAPIAEQKPYPAYTLPLEEEIPPVYTEPVKQEEPVRTIPVEQPEPKPEPKPRKKKPVWIVAVAAILAVVALVGFFSVGSGNETASSEMNVPENSASVQEETAAVVAEPNVLISDSSENTDTVFGSDYLRSKIGTITFWDTLQKAPDTSWDVSAARDGSVLAWVEKDTYALEESNNLYIGAEGGVIAPVNCDYLFAEYTGLRTIDFNNAFNTENVSSMRGMFQRSSLRSLDLSNWDTGSVEDMSDMFSGCNILSSISLDGWDTSNVTDMSGMFHYCRALEMLDVSNFDTANVTNMGEMFAGCEKVTSLDVSGFNTSRIESLTRMFANCNQLKELDVSKFDTSNVTNMRSMFYGCCELAFLDISQFDTSNVTDIGSMFYNCSSLKSLDVSGFNTSKVISMGSAFESCSSITQLDISGFDTSNVTDMQRMFSGCVKLTSLNVGEFDTSRVWIYNSFMDKGKKVKGQPWEKLFEKDEEEKWENNVLMHDPATNEESSYVYGSDITRDLIISATFLDTTYEAPETSWDVSVNQDGSVLAWIIENGKYYDLYIAADGGINGKESRKDLFSYYTQLEKVNFNGSYHAEASETGNMFLSCRSLKHITISGAAMPRFHIISGFTHINSWWTDNEAVVSVSEVVGDAVNDIGAICLHKPGQAVVRVIGGERFDKSREITIEVIE